jgi:hypothetical protein
VAFYLYELRRGDDVVATGQLSRVPPFEVGGGSISLDTTGSSERSLRR